MGGIEYGKHRFVKQMFLTNLYICNLLMKAAS